MESSCFNPNLSREPEKQLSNRSRAKNTTYRVDNKTNEDSYINSRFDFLLNQNDENPTNEKIYSITDLGRKFKEQQLKENNEQTKSFIKDSSIQNTNSRKNSINKENKEEVNNRTFIANKDTIVIEKTKSIQGVESNKEDSDLNEIADYEASLMTNSENNDNDEYNVTDTENENDETLGESDTMKLEKSETNALDNTFVSTITY